MRWNFHLEVLIHRVEFQCNSLTASEYFISGVANTLGALAKLRYPQEKLVSKLCRDALSQVQDFTAQAIATTLRALAKFPFDFDDHSLIPGLLAFSQQRIHEFTPQGLAALLDAYQAFGPGFYDDLLIALLKECRAKSKLFIEQDIVACFSALSRMNFKEGELAHLKLVMRFLSWEDTFVPRG